MEALGMIETKGLVALIEASLGANLPLLAQSFGMAGYICPLSVITAGYALFQAANNTAVMTQIHPDQRGVTSGLLNLSRNLGLISGASVMGAVFSRAAAGTDIMTAGPAAIADGMRMTFAVAAALVFVALAMASASQVLVQLTAGHATRSGAE